MGTHPSGLSPLPICAHSRDPRALQFHSNVHIVSQLSDGLHRTPLLTDGLDHLVSVPSSAPIESKTFNIF